jgi:hypothetical protein
MRIKLVDPIRSMMASLHMQNRMAKEPHPWSNKSDFRCKPGTVLNPHGIGGALPGEMLNPYGYNGRKRRKK